MLSIRARDWKIAAREAAKFDDICVWYRNHELYVAGNKGWRCMYLRHFTAHATEDAQYARVYTGKELSALGKSIQSDGWLDWENTTSVEARDLCEKYERLLDSRTEPCAYTIPATGMYIPSTYLALAMSYFKSWDCYMEVVHSKFNVWLWIFKNMDMEIWIAMLVGDVA